MSVLALLRNDRCEIFLAKSSLDSYLIKTCGFNTVRHFRVDPRYFVGSVCVMIRGTDVKCWLRFVLHLGGAYLFD